MVALGQKVADMLRVDRSDAGDGLVVKNLKRVYRRVRGRLGGGPRPQDQDYSLAVPFSGLAPHLPRPKVAVVLHLFYMELASDILDQLQHIDAPCDLLITTDSVEKQLVLESVFAGWSKGKVDVRAVANRGRDIAPKLTAFAADYRQYELLLFLHSKRTTSSTYGDDWREQLYGGLCGSSATVESIFTLFAQDRTLGMVYPQVFEPIRPYMRWSGLESPAKQLARRLGVNLNPAGTLEFPVGSMFWARPAALQPLIDLGLRVEDFPTEAGQTHGTIAHAIERLFVVSCELAGLTWCKVAVPELYENKATILQVRSIEELHQARQRAAFKATEAMVKA